MSGEDHVMVAMLMAGGTSGGNLSTGRIRSRLDVMKAKVIISARHQDHNDKSKVTPRTTHGQSAEGRRARCMDTLDSVARRNQERKRIF